MSPRGLRRPNRMSTYVLVPGAGGEAWYWSRVVPLLEAAGHEAIAVELPAADDEATLYDYADTILEAIGDRAGVILVAQSMGAFSAPVAAGRTDGVAEIALVAPMIPAPGENVDNWWSTSGHTMDEPFDPVTTFFHDVPQEIVDEALRRDEPDESAAACAQPWPLDAWPDVPTRVLVGRHDRLFPYTFARAVANVRLGIEPDVIDTGHLPALAKPRELVDWLLAAATPA